MTQGWGQGHWGSTPWGTGVEGVIVSPTIVPLSPVDGDTGVAPSANLVIRLADDLGIDLSKTRITVDGLTWFLGGAGMNGSDFRSVVNDQHGFDLTLFPPAPYDNTSQQEVMVFTEDVDGNIATLVYSFLVGVGGRLLQVQNPFANTLLAYFNRPMLTDAAFFSPESWVITPISAGAAPLSIDAVSIQDGHSSVASLAYSGGGSVYRLTVIGIHDGSGLTLENGYDSIEFEIAFGDQPAPQIRLFNSIFGPLGISQQVRTRRTMDDHVANRALALALDAQFRLRAGQLDATVGRDGRPGKART